MDAQKDGDAQERAAERSEGALSAADAAAERALIGKTTLLCWAGGLLFGYNSGIIAGAAPLIQHEYGLSDGLVGVLVASLLVGMAIGTPAGGWIADRAGRKATTLACGVLCVVGSLGTAALPSFAALCLFRLVGGVAVGVAITAVPLYVSEVAPTERRGSLATLFQVAICAGILVAYLANVAFNPGGEAGGGEWRWRLMFAWGALPGLAMAYLVRVLPESARWLAATGRTPSREPLLQEPAPSPSPPQASAESASAEEGPLAALFAPQGRRRLALVMVITFGNQFTGINVIMYFAPVIFVRSGFGSSSLLPTVAVGVWNLLTSAASTRVVDRFGRRPLIVWSLVVMSAANFLLGLAFAVESMRAHLGAYALVSILAFVAAFEFGIGPLFYVVIGELYPQRTRGAAVGLCSCLLCAYNVLISVSFLSVTAAVGTAAVFLFFAAVGALTAAYVHRELPETRGRSLEELQSSAPGAPPPGP